MFFFFISQILSLSCTYSVTAVNQPMSYTFNVDEGEYICINSSLSYATVVFHNSIIKARYFLHSNIGTSVESGNFLFPAEKGGISFGAKTGSIDVMALLPGNVSFSVFSFPSICIGRYVTTKQSKEIVLKDEFGDFLKGYYCIWYPQSKYTVMASEVPEDPDSISICEKATDCRDPFSNSQLEETIKTPSFFKLHAHTIDFYKHFQLSFELKSKRPSIPFDMEGSIEITQVTLFDVSAPKVSKKDEEKEREIENEKEKLEKEEKNIEDDFERNEKEEQKENMRKQPPFEIPPRHDNRRSSRKEISPGEIIAMVIVVCGIIVTFVTCFLCGGTDSLCKRLNSITGKRRFDEDENRQSEARLLGNGQGKQPMMIAMMPVYSAQNQQQQMPLTGVYFPPVTSDESANIQAVNNQNNNQNMQAQPLLLLPNPPVQNANQNQPGMQPQYFIPQQYYPQYAFAQQPPQIQNPIPPTSTLTNTNSPSNTVTDASPSTPTNQ